MQLLKGYFTLLMMILGISYGWSQASTFVSGTPAPGATNVPRNTTVILVINDIYALISTTFSVVRVRDTVTNTIVPGVTTGTHDTFTQTTTLTFTPSSLLDSDRVYEVLADGIVNENNMPVTITGFPSPYLFTTACDFTFVSGTPAHGAVNVPVNSTVQLQFSCPLSTTSTIQVLKGAVPVIGTNTVSGNTITFTPLTPLEYNTTYTVLPRGISDAFGNTPTGFPASYTFTTQSPPPLNLVSSTPTNGATNVSVNTSIQLVFDQPLSATSTIVVQSPSGTVSGTTSIAGNQLTFIPASPLNYNTLYTVDYSGVRSVHNAAPSSPTPLTFTTEAPPTVSLIGSSPVPNALNVPRDSAIVLRFNGAIDPNTTFTVRGANTNVLGTFEFSNGNQTITFTPLTPLDPAVTYTVDFSSLRTLLGGTLLGPYTFTFRTAGGARIVGVSVPQIAQAGTNERLTLSYQIRNESDLSVSITGSRVYYYLPNGTLLAQVELPVSGRIPPQASFSTAGEIQIDEAMVTQARTAGFDSLLLVRVFTGVDENGTPITSLTDYPVFSGFLGDRALFGQGVVITTPVRLLSSMSSAVRVQDIVVTFPAENQIVPQNASLGARALVRATGNGTIVGRWLVNGIPVESFTASVVAGLPLEVSTLRSLPTLNIGTYQLELEIVSPEPLRSRAIPYIVSGLARTGVPQPLTPRRGAVISAREYSDLVYRWQVVAGASGCEIGFATSLADLGLGEDGHPMEVAPDAFAPDRLIVYRRVDSPLVNSIRLTEEEYQRLANAGRAILFWAVRPLFPPDNQALLQQTSPPAWIVVVGGTVQVQLTAPTHSEVVSIESLTFRWEPMDADTLYQVEVFAGETPILQAQTYEAFYEYDPLVPIPLQSSQTYRWRVLAIVPGVGVVAVSEFREFRIAESRQARWFHLRNVPLHRVMGYQAQVEFTPVNGATVNTQRPEIRVRYADAQPGKVRLYLDNIDMSRLATFSDTEAQLSLPRVLEPGEHEILLVYLSTSGERMEARSRFRIDLAGGAPQVESREPDQETMQIIARLRLQLDSQFLAQDQDFSWDSLTQSITTDGGYGARTAEVEGAIDITGSRSPHGRYDVNRVLGTFNYRGDRFQMAIGDVGVQASSFTVSGLGTRAFQTQFPIGNLRFTYTKTVGPVIGRTGLGHAMNMWVATLETPGFTQGRGVRIIRTSSVQSYSGFGSSISGSGLGIRASVWGIVGQYPISKWARFQAEVARSENFVPDVNGNEVAYRGDARTLSLQTQLPANWNGTVNYRHIESSFRSPAAQSLTSDLVGWDVNLNGGFSRYLNLSFQYGLLKNASSSTTPRSENRSWGVSALLNLPRWIPLQLGFRQTEAESDPFIPGGRPANNRDRQYTVGFNTRWGRVDVFVNYTFARYDDFQDMLDPNVDIPNDRETRFISIGLGWQSGNFTVRGDWSDNRLSRYARDPLLLNLLRGDDSALNLRFQTEYQMGKGWSLSGTYGRGQQRDMLGLGVGKNFEYQVRLNWTPLNLANGRFQFSLEWRQTGSLFGGNKTVNTLWVLLLNDSRLFSLR